MPRYFFHVQDGLSLKDDGGTELEGREEAWRAAVDLAGGILRGRDRTMRPGEGMVLTVVEDGEQVCWRIRVSSEGYVPDPRK